MQNLSTYATRIPPHHRLITNKSWHHGTKELKERNYSYYTQGLTYENSQWADLLSGNAAELCALEYVTVRRRRPCLRSSSVRLIAKRNENAIHRHTSVCITQRVSQSHFNNIRSWICLGLTSNRRTLQEPVKDLFKTDSCMIYIQNNTAIIYGFPYVWKYLLTPWGRVLLEK